MLKNWFKKGALVPFYVFMIISVALIGVMGSPNQEQKTRLAQEPARMVYRAGKMAYAQYVRQIPDSNFRVNSKVGRSLVLYFAEQADLNLGKMKGLSPDEKAVNALIELKLKLRFLVKKGNGDRDQLIDLIQKDLETVVSLAST